MLGVLPGTIGTIQATEALKLILGIGDPLIGRLLLYNALDMSFEFVKLRKNPNCKVCGPNPEVTELIDYEAFCGVPGHDRGDSGLESAWEISAGELAKRLEAGNAHPPAGCARAARTGRSRTCRGRYTHPARPAGRALSELDSAEEMVVFCKAGTRSARALELLVQRRLPQGQEPEGRHQRLGQGCRPANCQSIQDPPAG